MNPHVVAILFKVCVLNRVHDNIIKWSWCSQHHIIKNGKCLARMKCFEVWNQRVIECLRSKKKMWELDLHDALEDVDVHIQRSVALACSRGLPTVLVMITQNPQQSTVGSNVLVDDSVCYEVVNLVCSTQLLQGTQASRSGAERGR